MLAESVIATRDALKKDNRHFRLFFDNNVIINSLADVISWNDDLKVLHVIRATADPSFQKFGAIEVLTYGYEDIRTLSYYINTDEISAEMVNLLAIGATDFTEDRGNKIEKYYTKVFSGEIDKGNTK